jgi:glycosyltransferase involved in cell wall biosynthesis
MFLSLCMMIKNEEKNLLKTLESVKNIIDSCIMFDTGSEDNTLSILKEWCSSQNKPLYLKEGTFRDFSYSRNELLEYADTIPSEYLLLMDGNDELKEDIKFLQFLQNFKEKTDAIMLQQCWLTNGVTDKYWNIRCVKNNKGWRYFGRVHEWISKTNRDTGEKIKAGVSKAPPECILYQDRNADMEKSLPRFQRDKVLLLEDHHENPKDSRTVFYLAQTLGSTGDIQDAYYYYKLRTTLDGFTEEVFHSYLRLGAISQGLKHPWEESLKWYIKAYDHSHRAEPLVQIAHHYIDENNFRSAFMYLSECIKLEYPHSSILFVNRDAYDYSRWHLMGRCAYYVKEYEIGAKACEEAIKTKNLEVDINNLEFYKKKFFKI